MTRDELKHLEDRYSLTLGLHAFALDDPSARVDYRDRETFPAASTIKLYILAKLLQSSATGRVSFDAELVVRRDDKVSGSGVLKALEDDRAYTVLDLATLMIIVSDNTATNLLIDLLGTDVINDYCCEQGWNDTHLAGKLQVSTAPPTSSSYTTPRDLADVMYRLWTGALAPVFQTEVARRILSAQHYTDQLGREIGYDPYSSEVGEDDLRIASKSGSIRGVRNDVGIITRSEKGFVIAIMTKGAADLRFYPDNSGSRAIMDATSLAHKQFLR